MPCIGLREGSFGMLTRLFSFILTHAGRGSWPWAFARETFPSVPMDGLRVEKPAPLPRITAVCELFIPRPKFRSGWRLAVFRFVRRVQFEEVSPAQG